MKALLFPNQDQLMSALVDITAPSFGVEVHKSVDGSILWVNVDGVCVLRVCRSPSIVIEDETVRTHRTVQIGATVRQASSLRSLLKQAIRRCDRKIANSDFVPEPGKFDANVSKRSIYEDLKGQIDSQLPTKEESDAE